VVYWSERHSEHDQEPLVITSEDEAIASCHWSIDWWFLTLYKLNHWTLDNLLLEVFKQNSVLA